MHQRQVEQAFPIGAQIAAALVFPAGLLIAARGIYVDLVFELASERLWMRWALSLTVVLAVVAECHWLTCLGRFVRAGGSVRRYHAIVHDAGFIQRRRRNHYRLAAVAIASVAALLLAEGAFRLMGFEPSRKFVEGADCTQAVDNSLNALGIREDWDRLDLSEDTLRVAFLGDSFTYGFNVERDQTFVHVVEAQLRDPSGRQIVTINLGKPATAPGTQLPIYLRTREALKPRVVVHVLYPNDLGAETQLPTRNLHRLQHREPWLGNGIRIVAFLEQEARYWYLWNQTLGFFRGGRTPGEQARSWEEFELDLRACKDQITADGALYGIVLFPWIYRLPGHPLRDVHSRIEGIARALDVPFLDLYDALAAFPESEIRICGLDEHPNKNGHQIAAECIGRFVNERLLSRLNGGHNSSDETAGRP